MATSWGIDPLKDVNNIVTMGTSAVDFRLIQGGLYSPGLISGGQITRSASTMSYTVAAGVAAFPIITTGAKQTVLGPIPATTISTTAATSGTRVDMIFAEQRTIATDGDPAIVVRIGTSLPPRAVLLDSFIVSTNTANTNAAVRTGNIAYSIPYGASLGTLWSTRSTYNGEFTVKSVVGSGTFYLPTDRNVQVSASSSLSAADAVRFDNAKYCEVVMDVTIDGVKRFSWSTGGLHQAWVEWYWADSMVLAAGNHTITFERSRSQGPGTPVQRYGAGNLGNLCKIDDIGPAV